MLAMGKRNMAKKNSKQPSKKTSEIQTEPIATAKPSIDDAGREEKIQQVALPESSLNQALQNLAEALQNSRSQPEPRKRFARFAEQFNTFRTILTNLLLISLTLIFIFIAYRELTKDVVLIEPFEVPEELGKKGYTGRAIANRLIDQIDLIKTTAKTSLERKQFIAEWSRTQLDVQVPGAAISLRSFLEYIKEFWGNPPSRIGGEIFVQSDSLSIVVRGVGNLTKTISGRLENLDEMLRQAGLHIYKYTQPYTLALYFYNKNDEKASIIEVVEYIISHEPPDDDVGAYNLWGIVLHDQLKYEEAIAKYKKAIELDPKGIPVYGNWGNVLADQRDYEGAIAKYKKLIDLDPKNAIAYFNWGTVLQEQKDYDGAIAKFEKAIEFDPRDATAYFNWGKVLQEQKDYDGAIAKFEKAIELDPNGEIGTSARNSINAMRKISSKE